MWLLEQTWRDKMPKWMTKHLSDKNLSWLYHCDCFCPSIHSPTHLNWDVPGPHQPHPVLQWKHCWGRVSHLIPGFSSLCLNCWVVNDCTNLWSHAWRSAGQNRKIVPSGPAAPWFGVLCVVQKTGALPCLKSLAVVLCDGLKSDIKQHLGSSYEIIAAAPWWRGAPISLGCRAELWALGICAPAHNP